MKFQKLIDEAVAEIKNNGALVYIKGDDFDVTVDPDIEDYLEESIRDFSLGDSLITEIKIENLEPIVYLGDGDIVVQDKESGEAVAYMIIDDEVEGVLTIKGYRER